MNRQRVIPVVVGLAVVGLGVYLAVRNGGVDGALLASGTVEATEASLGFQVPGRVERIVPDEGDRVTAGDELAWLDRTELEAGARTEELAQAREAARAATERYADAQRDFQRVERLLQGGAVSQEAYDKAKLALEVATSQRDQAAQQLSLVETGPRPERIAAQRAAVAQGEAAVRQVEAALANAVITAPFDGVVTIRDREPGETAGAGAPVLTLMNLNDRWVRIYIREDRIGAVQVGQEASITADTYPDKQYRGTVSFISSQAEFTPRNVQTAEERVKLVYAVKVRILGDPANQLKPGMPADVRLEMGTASSGRR